VSASGNFGAVENFRRIEEQRCGGLGAVLGYHSVFSPSNFEAIQSDALI
jgi:hypothetical protein